MQDFLTQFVGYVASFLVVLSFMLKDIKKIRMVNLMGCVCFVLYGFFNGLLWPIIIPNAFLCAIQLYHLLKSTPD